MVDYQLAFGDLWDYRDQFLDGLWLTVVLTIITTVLGIAMGIIGAAIRTSGKGPLKLFTGAYVELIRNTPFIVQLFFIFFGLPAMGLTLDAWQAGLIAMVINLGAYSTEIIRAGIEATPKGQIEAAKSLGLSARQTFIRVVLPPAIERIYPALSSQAIIVMLGSAVLSQISVEELTFAANFVQSRTFRSFESYLVIAVVYLLLSLCLRMVFNAVAIYLFPKKGGQNARV